VRIRLRLPELGLRVSIALIVIAIGLVGFIQFTWFRQSASVEIDGAYHSLNATVLQTMSREFQRYAPLLADLRDLGSDDGALSDRGLRSLLERELGLYGPEGSVPRLISMVGTVAISDPGATSVLVSAGTWEPEPSPFALPIPDSAQRQLADGGLVVCGGGEGPRGSEGPGGERQFILAPAGPRRLAVIELDTEGFFASYTMPAVAGALPESKIEWSTDLHDGSRDPGVPVYRRQQPRRDFNPLLALFGGSPKERLTFAIVVPATMDAFVMRGMGWFESWAPGARSDGSYRPLQGGEGPDPRAAFSMRVARILVSSSSVVGSVERRLALNWLFSLLLLLGLGYAFAQAVIQKNKLGIISKREREFVASVTHELRTPVTAIRSAADNMRRGLVGQERMSAYGEMINAQSLRLGSMIEEVLLFSQVEGRDSQPPVPAPIQVEELEREIRAPLEAIARAEGIEVSWDFGSLPKLFLGDLDTIRLVLSNLVANALYHAYPGTEKGEVRVTGKALLPDALQFSVEDDGRGIARKDASLVFEPFYRDEASRARHEKGSGLGLFIARRKARLLGGNLRLESPYERVDGVKRPGCRFVLELPFLEAADDR
jgi:signal transduction histidine kinase